MFNPLAGAKELDFPIDEVSDAQLLDQLYSKLEQVEKDNIRLKNQSIDQLAQLGILTNTC